MKGDHCLRGNVAPKFILQPYCGPVKGFLAMPGPKVVGGFYDKMSCIVYTLVHVVGLFINFVRFGRSTMYISTGNTVNQRDTHLILGTRKTPDMLSIQAPKPSFRSLESSGEELLVSG